MVIGAVKTVALNTGGSGDLGKKLRICCIFPFYLAYAIKIK